MTFLTHITESTLQRLVEGALPEAEAHAAMTHIESCAPCRRRSTELSALFGALSAPRALPEAPADFFASVMARVDREPGLVPQKIRPRVAIGAVAAGLVTAAAGGALVAAGGGVALSGAELATGFVTLVGKAGLLGTLAKAAAPVLAAASLASAAVLSPFLVRALREAAPRNARATVRH